MKLADRIIISLKALRQLGVEQVGLYTLYQLGLSTGHYHRQLTSSLSRLEDLAHEPYINLHTCLPGLPDRDAMLDLLGDQVLQLYKQADEVVSGKVRLFGGLPVPLILNPGQPLSDWTTYVGGNNQIEGKDIKYVWEPGRFGWACTLAMAYYLSNDERYADTFWQNTEYFLKSNPPYLGPHWSSAQEVGIRLVALAFALQVFSRSRQARPERLKFLAQAIAFHAERIPPTLAYARSLNNNHLISEALGLYTASALLSEHPLAPKWYSLGWKWLLHAIRTQIDQDGTYIQHSTNYHRLMLQAAVWAFAVHDSTFIDEPIPEDVITRLIAATQWLWKLVDPDTGRVPNLGHNDGAYILPLTVSAFHDYRPVIHAAAQTFNRTLLSPPGIWNDFSYWLSTPLVSTRTNKNLVSWQIDAAGKDLVSQTPHILKNPKNDSWAYFRVTRFHSRPAHADQLHLDLWWRGMNLAQDPGTYLYNATSPWENSLTSAFVHNTVIVDEQEFMRRAGRFLYLDWDQAETIPTSPLMGDNYPYICAKHNGYEKVGVTHSRIVASHHDGHWDIIDNLGGSPNRKHTIRLHWLLPDWEYEVHDTSDRIDYPSHEILLRSPYGVIALQTGFLPRDKEKQPLDSISIKLARAGELQVGMGAISPNAGWTSPTYGIKKPALAYIFEITGDLPIVLMSKWILPDET